MNNFPTYTDNWVLLFSIGGIMDFRTLRGNYQENSIAQAIEREFPEAKVFMSFRVYDEYSHKPVEIDILVVSEFGVYSIESKRVKGAVYGEEYDEKWIIKQHRNGMIPIENPVRQNEKHIRAINTALKIRNLPKLDMLQNIVCVSLSGNVRVYTDSLKVYTLPELLYKLKTDRNIFQLQNKRVNVELICKLLEKIRYRTNE